MITFEQLPFLYRIAAKIDLAAMAKLLGRKDLLPDGFDKEKISDEKMAEIVFEFAAVLIPKMEEINEDIVGLVAATKGIHVDDAKKLDAIQSIKDLLSEAGVLDFFKKYLKQKAGQKQ